jgi:3-oxoacyl-[acyl-carrier protein] reductase
MQIPSLREKNVLVTGSGTGIGREVGLEFARQGANVAFHYSSTKTGAVEAVKESLALGVKACVFQADFSRLDDVRRLGGEVLEEFGRIDILVNNAGITFNKPFLKVEPAQFEKIYDVNIRASFFLSQALVPAMIAAGKGAICNITSIHGIAGAAEHAAYAGTKGAIIAQTRALAVELAQHGVRVNAVAPGWIAVEGHYDAMPGYEEEAVKKIAYEKVPIGCYGLPLDVARLVAFVCSDAASYLVGQTLVLDGGTTALMSLLPDFRTESEARFGQKYL